MTTPFDLAEQAAGAIRGLGAPAPRLAVILGSGLTDAVPRDRVVAEAPFADLPGFPGAGVPGHAGRVRIAALAGVPTLVFAGRLHGYEGHDLATIVHPVRTAARLGVEALVITCAAGGIRNDLDAGDLVLVHDHLNPSGEDPLRGPHDDRLGPRFTSLVDAYDPRLRTRLARAGADGGVTMSAGVYARVPGPSYETPADVLALRTLGADLVGMSLVPEVIAARQAGIRVAAVAVVTNRAAGLDRAPPAHEDVVAVARDAAVTLAGVLERFAADWSDA